MLTVFSGCMASNKSNLLFCRLAWLESQKIRVCLTLPKNAHANWLVTKSRAGPERYPLPFKDHIDLERFASKEDVLAIDEIQNQALWVAEMIEQLVERGKHIVVAGRDTNFRGEPFPIMERLAALAEEHTRLTAVCAVCLHKAVRSQRLVRGEPAHWDSDILEKGPPTETYEARCLTHHLVPGRPKI